ncbi:hypothetical protein CC77DRAFT_617685 [Alternaria alternata]|uniref:Uncharacterized protein n=1 Tax=Alternaria alternata TaxID=5599 RepID=A0A177DWV7_ALTAL|nr:hypothetical protein CC77DRAFT_617685 [Alternaria alternata]OAG23671.1 hypothetical protein CC77DRAFT_617685 [Alternaria alternata]
MHLCTEQFGALSAKQTMHYLSKYSTTEPFLILLLTRRFHENTTAHQLIHDGHSPNAGVHLNLMIPRYRTAVQAVRPTDSRSFLSLRRYSPQQSLTKGCQFRKHGYTKRRGVPAISALYAHRLERCGARIARNQHILALPNF